MRAACLRCHRQLPPNDVVEAFPFGRRVAYDPKLQRFWAVCERCGKWSLAPIEPDERANAIDFFERWWRSTSAHYTAGGIGVGNYSPRLSVVRIGTAQWNEFASWRYASTIRKRRYVRYVRTGAALGVVGAAWASGFFGSGLILAGAFGALGPNLFVPYLWLRSKDGVCRIPTQGGVRQLLRRRDLMETELVPSPESEMGWSLNTSHAGGVTKLDGAEGVRALTYALPLVNRMGGTGRSIEDAFQFITESGGPEGAVRRAASHIGHARYTRPRDGLISAFPLPLRIALEMATHEQEERRALENELSLLRNEWLEAAEIAGVVEQELSEPALTMRAGKTSH